MRVVRKRYPFYLYAYVLMSNHFHLLLEVQRSPTARILQSLLTGCVRRFNRTARQAGIEPEALRRKGRMATIVEDRDRFIRGAVFEEGYLASEVAGFLACHPSNVSRALQKNNLS